MAINANAKTTLSSSFTDSFTVEGQAYSTSVSKDYSVTNSNGIWDACWFIYDEILDVSSSITYDLLELVDAQGNILEFGYVNHIMIYNKSTNGAQMSIGNDANHIAIYGDTSSYQPVTAGMRVSLLGDNLVTPVCSVTDGSNILKVTNDSSEYQVSYDIEILGKRYSS